MKLPILFSATFAFLLRLVIAASALISVGFSPTLWAQTQVDDLFGRGGCMTQQQLEQVLTRMGGQIALTLDGHVLSDVRLDEKRRHVLVTYPFGGASRLAVLRQKLGQSDMGKLCVWLHSDGKRSAISNPASGFPPTEEWFDQYDDAAAYRDCTEIRPAWQKLRDKQQSIVGDKAYTGTELEAMRRSLLSETQRKREDYEREQDERNARDIGGDSRCRSLRHVTNGDMRVEGRKLVVLSLAKELQEDGQVKLPEIIFALYVIDPAFLRSPQARTAFDWSLRFVMPSGAAYWMGHGEHISWWPKAFSQDPGSRIARIVCLEDGILMMNGVPADMATVEVEIKRLERARGVVWIGGQSAEPLSNVLVLAVRNNIPISLSPDWAFTHYLDEYGHTHLRR